MAKKKKNKKVKKGGKTKAVGPGLEGFMDWKNLIASEPVEEREESCCPIRFTDA